METSVNVPTCSPVNYVRDFKLWIVLWMNCGSGGKLRNTVSCFARFPQVPSHTPVDIVDYYNLTSNLFMFSIICAGGVLHTCPTEGGLGSWSIDALSRYHLAHT